MREPSAGTASPVGRRAQILRVASTLFARHGFHGVSIDDLGAAVGLSGPALYRHFRAKEEILAAMLLDVSQRLVDEGQHRVAAAPDAGSALSALIDWHVEFALHESALITVQSRDMANLPESPRRAVRELQLRYVALWVGPIEELTGCGPATAVAAAHAVFGLINSTPHSARLPVGQMAPLLRRMATAAVLATPTSAEPQPPPGPTGGVRNGGSSRRTDGTSAARGTASSARSRPGRADRPSADRSRDAFGDLGR
jgi:AcrR family transcriptional regulator